MKDDFNIEEILQSVGFESTRQFIYLSEIYMGFGKKWPITCPQTREEKLEFLLDNGSE
jgi:hypothetical protein